MTDSTPSAPLRAGEREPWSEPKDPTEKTFGLGLLSLIPLLGWWLGWYPGVLSSDSIDQLTQVEQFQFSNHHPAFHTLYLWALTRIWDSPGMVGLIQIIALAVLLAVIARRLTQVGIPRWLAIGAVWVVAVWPAVAATTIAIWKDVPYNLALLWVFAELLLLARLGRDYWEPVRSARLGIALSLVWLLRHNGFFTVLVLVVLLLAAYRRHWRALLPALGTLALIVVLVLGPLFALLPVDRRTSSTDVAIGDVAAVVTHEPRAFEPAEIRYLETIAPLEVWRDSYTCYDSTLLAFHPQFDREVLRQDPDRFWALAAEGALEEPGVVLGNHACASSYLFLPPQPSAPAAHLHKPPFDIPENHFGLEREPLSWRAYLATRAMYAWAEQPGWLWLTWRPALPLWLALLTYLGVGLRRSLRPLLWPGAVLIIQTLSLTLTPLAPEFRFAYGVYLMSWLSLPLAWLVWRPERAEAQSD